MDTTCNNNVAMAVLHLGKHSITIYHFCNGKKIHCFTIVKSQAQTAVLLFPQNISSRIQFLKQMKTFTCTSDNMCITHEEWCTVQMGGRQQSSTDMHLDTELAVDKGWERASTTKKSIMFSCKISQLTIMSRSKNTCYKYSLSTIRS